MNLVGGVAKSTCATKISKEAMKALFDQFKAQIKEEIEKAESEENN